MRQTSSDGGVANFLESDRVASLLVEMASSGVVDFKDANLLDRKWQLRLKWLSKSYTLNKSSEVVKLAILRYTGALGYGTSALFNEAWDRISELIEQHDKLTRPWTVKEDKDK